MEKVISTFSYLPTEEALRVTFEIDGAAIAAEATQKKNGMSVAVILNFK